MVLSLFCFLSFLPRSVTEYMANVTHLVCGRMGLVGIGERTGAEAQFWISALGGVDGYLYLMFPFSKKKKKLMDWNF